MFSWINKKLNVRDGGIAGKGIFAKEALIKDEKLAVFGGYIMNLKQEATLDKRISDYAHQIDDNLVIGINRIEDIQDVDYFNHSCEPNAGFRGQIFLVAMRDIEIGEEITFDYAMTLGGDTPYELKCTCGKSTCRKVIKNSDWMISELQDRYRGYFQNYLEDKMNKQNDK